MPGSMLAASSFATRIATRPPPETGTERELGQV
jgi:hypothetical protein